MQGLTRKNNCHSRSCKVKKGLETLRKLAPKICIEKMVDKIQEKIVKRKLDDKVRSSPTDDSSFSQQKSVPKVQVGRLRPKKPNVFTQSSPPQKIQHKIQSKNSPNPRYAQESDKNFKAELQQISKQDDQKILLNRYIQGHFFLQIRDQFQLKYPESKKIFTTKTIRLKFNRTLRKVLHYFENLTKKFAHIRLPKLQKLDNLRIRSIRDDPYALACRIKVLEVYLSDNITSTLIREAIETINKYFHEKDNQE